MKKIFSLFLVVVFVQSFSQIERPKLVVGIVVDQMRTDYLYRYHSDYGDGGFKRLMSQGFVFKNTHFNYMPTYTAPGHSSIYTGTTPAIHGIVGNSWYHKSEGEVVYCTTDKTMKTLGMDDPDNKAGRMSPVRLKATTITDELKLDTNFRGKVIGVSIKDRGAILPAGHFADAAYWLNKQGQFISSSFYFDQMPKWVNDFNKKKHTQKFIKQGWDLLYPMRKYDESLPDNNPYEKIFKPKTLPIFPYNLKEIAKEQGNYEIIKSTPFGNDLVAMLSKEAVKNENLGQDEFTDFLAVSFSSTDYVGHRFSPRSVEIQDTYLRLDKTLEDFLKFLDQKVGEGNYLVFLTADHAAAENPNFLKDRKYDVKNLDRKQIKNEIKTFVDSHFGEGLFVEYKNQNIFLNESLIEERQLDYDKIVKAIQKELNKKPYISEVYSREELNRGNPTDYHLSMIARGYDNKQNGDLVILLDPQYIEYSDYGTTHGSTYMYDTHVPNIWYGWGVKPGKSAKRHKITEIAPTVSQMLNIPIPNGSKGNVLNEVLE